MSDRTRLVRGIILILLASSLTGCYDTGIDIYTSQDCSAQYCSVTTLGRVRAFQNTGLVAKVLFLEDETPSGPQIEPAIRVPCPCGTCSTTDSLTAFLSGTFVAGATVHYYVTCGDPVLVEIPNDWGLTGSSYSLTPTGSDGLINALGMSFYKIPPECGPLVLDPGCYANVLQFNTSSMPTQTVYCHFQFRYNALRSAYVKGVDVGTFTILENNEHVLFPVNGGNLDLTAVQPPDPRALLLGPDVPTPARRPTWGALKTIYR